MQRTELTLEQVKQQLKDTVIAEYLRELETSFSRGEIESLNEKLHKKVREVTSQIQGAQAFTPYRTEEYKDHDSFQGRFFIRTGKFMDQLSELMNENTKSSLAGKAAVDEMAAFLAKFPN